MDGVLLDLYQIAGARRQLRLEDFLSLATGREMASNQDFADAVIAVLKDKATGRGLDPMAGRLDAWAANPNRACTVIAQRPVASHGGTSWGWADLQVDLTTPGALTDRLRIVVEAKVGDAAPKKRQLERYAGPLGADLLVALVRDKVRVRQQVGEDPVWHVLVLTWTDIWVAARAHAAELARLLERSGEIGGFATVTADGFLQAQDLTLNSGPALEAACAAVLVASCCAPGGNIEGRVRRALDDIQFRATPTFGRGTGFLRDGALRSTRLRGATLGVRPSVDDRGIVWQLEVRPTKAGARHLDRTGGWEVVREYPSWYALDLRWSPREEQLGAATLAQLVTEVSAALAPLFDARLQPGELADAVVASVSELDLGAVSTGIRRSAPVLDTLRAATRQIADAGVRARNRRAKVTSKGHKAWATTRKRKRRLCAWYEFGPERTALGITMESDDRKLLRQWRRIAKAARSDGNSLAEKLVIERLDNLRSAWLPLDDETWPEGEQAVELLSKLAAHAMSRPRVPPR